MFRFKYYLGPVRLGISGQKRSGTFLAQYKISNDSRPEIVPGPSSPETNGPLVIASKLIQRMPKLKLSIAW